MGLMPFGFQVRNKLFYISNLSTGTLYELAQLIHVSSIDIHLAERQSLRRSESRELFQNINANDVLCQGIYAQQL